LEFSISFKWERKGDKPTKGTSFGNHVVLNGEVYLEGNSDPCVIHQYTPAKDTWAEFKKPILMCGMAALNEKLILVGSDGVMTWNSEAQEWMYSYPPVPTKRSQSAVVSYKSYIVVAGGSLDDSLLQSTTAVDVLDTDSGKWYRAPPMPYNGYGITPVVIGEHLYLQFGMRGTMTMSKSILKVSLPTLISHTFAGKNRDTSIWEKLPDVPFYSSALFSIGNMLLTAGGMPTGLAGVYMSVMTLQSYKFVSDIYLFNPFTNQWVKVGDLPEPRQYFICIAYSPGNLLFVGGDVGMKKPSFAVHTATIRRFHF
jgi:hypothetical protein